MTTHDALAWLMTRDYHIKQDKGVLSLYVNVAGCICYGINANGDPGMRFVQAVMMAKAEADKFIASGIKVMA